jgi:hypothetical protein
MPTYRKSSAFAGKDLVLTVGRSSMQILDGQLYTGERFAQFVQHGFLVEVPDADSPAPAPEPEPEPVIVAPAATADAPEAADEGDGGDDADGDADEGEPNEGGEAPTRKNKRRRK